MKKSRSRQLQFGYASQNARGTAAAGDVQLRTIVTTSAWRMPGRKLRSDARVPAREQRQQRNLRRLMCKGGVCGSDGYFMAVLRIGDDGPTVAEPAELFKLNSRRSIGGTGLRGGISHSLLVPSPHCPH